MKNIFILLLGFILFNINAVSQATGDYRSVASGPWATLATWERYNGAAWVAAPTAPTSTDGIITIRSPHTVQITANVSLDQVVIDAGATVNWTGGTCTFVNSAVVGPDLIINGTFWDNRGATTPSITFTGSTWLMGVNGNLVRSAGNSSNNWQAAYDGGIATIPATSNWILRRTTAQVPALSSTIPTTGSVYPNLIIENNTTTAWALGFVGIIAPQTIKGNLDIGGAGTGTGVITFTNSNTNTTPTLINGSMNVRSSHIYNNNGRGINLEGDLTVNGSFLYSGTAMQQLNFIGSNAQTINGTGTLNVRASTINKPVNGVTLNRTVSIDNQIAFTSGIVNTTSTNLLIINPFATAVGGSNTSYVNGPVRKIGNDGIIFPVGKSGVYRPCQLGNYTGPGSSAFWTENFEAGSGCGTLTIANGYVTSNGTWNVSSLSPSDPSANIFYVSAEENGNAAGTCGTGCGADRSLHIGNVSSSPAAFLFCPSGDCGAAYDAGFGGFDVTCNWRAESPVINCTGRSNIEVSFVYMEGGSGTLDNALLWYFDGATWTMISDMAKTVASCGGGQGLWTSFSIILPASANGNPNVRIGFQWVNNDDGAGSDPSFAVDDITITEVVPTATFTAEYFLANPQIPYGNILAPGLTAISNCEYWIIDRNTSSQPRAVLLSYDSPSCSMTGSVMDLRVARHDGAIWQNEGNGGFVFPYIATAADVINFSPFTLNDFISLPVALVKFEANCVDDQIKFDWSTSAEINNDYFTLERSNDIVSWYEIARISGNGNSNQLINYSYIANAFPDDYVRLVQYDFDGTRKAYDAYFVNCDVEQNYLIIYPNPTSQNINIATNEFVTNIEIINSQGQIIYNINENPAKDINLNINISSLANGMYVVKVHTSSKIYTEKVIIKK